MNANSMVPINIPPASEGENFTGERLVLGVGLDIEHEHFHRYVWAADLCTDLKVLDVASGDGYGTYILSQRAQHVTGCEIDGPTVEAAQKKYRADNLEYKCADCTQLPFENDSFDVVVSFETIEHINNYKDFVKEVERVLKPNGLFICSTPEIHEFGRLSQVDDNEFHVHEFEKEEFETLLEGHFSSVKLMGQSFAASSTIVPISTGPNTIRHYHSNQKKVARSDQGLLQPTFLIALATNATLPETPSSYFSSDDSKIIVSKLLIDYYEHLDKIANLESENDLALHELKIAEQRIEGFENSFSWRITSPIRFVSSRIKSLFATLTGGSSQEEHR